jgi:site-specific DNA recombinase
MRTPHLRAVSAPQTLQVAIYARVSSDQQAEHHTIDSQRAEFTARVAQDGHDVREDLRFIDNGHSGASLIRPALERLRDLVALSAIDLVYIYPIQRRSVMRWSGRMAAIGCLRIYTPGVMP